MATAEVSAPAVTDDCLIMEWDTCKAAMAEAAAIHESNPERSEDDAFTEVLEDQDYWDMAWEELTEALTDIMLRINPDGQWVAEGRAMGWRQRDAHANFEAQTGAELLAAVLPACDKSFRVYQIVDLLAINCAHHDSPTWKEWHYIRKRK